MDIFMNGGGISMSEVVINVFIGSQLYKEYIWIKERFVLKFWYGCSSKLSELWSG